MKLTHIRNLDVTEPLSSGHRFVSAASGLLQIDDVLYVIGDDEQHLMVFGPDRELPGRLLRLLPGELPQNAKDRKKLKPDFEILFRLPTPDSARSVVCAIGSGSKRKRMRSVLVDIATGEVTVIDLQPLFATLAVLTDDINLEGAVVRGDRLLLFNRGNMSNPETRIFETALSAITDGSPTKVRLLKTLALPFVDGVPLTVTDACQLDDGRVLLSAVAEVTDDSYADGDIVGAAIIVLDANLDIIAVEPLEPTLKIEGIAAQRTSAGIELLCVSDADDPDTASALYSATLCIA